MRTGLKRATLSAAAAPPQAVAEAAVQVDAVAVSVAEVVYVRENRWLSRNDGGRTGIKNERRQRRKRRKTS
jgi:hypothetical protein